jgi:ribosomal protein S25
MATARKSAKSKPAKKKSAARAAPAKKAAPAKRKPAARAAPAKKKKPAAATATPAAKAPRQVRVYTVDELAQRVGNVDGSGARALIRGLTDDELIDLGRRVATPRITTDGRRMYGTILDALARLTPAQRALLPTVTDGRIASSIGALAHGRDLHQRREGELGLRRSGRESTEVDATAVRERARALRAQLRDVLVDLLGERPEIDAAAGNVTTGAALSTALENLVDLLETKVLGTELRAELHAGSYGKGELAAIRKTAADARRLDDRAAAVQGIAEVPQSEVDLWDGINLKLLDRLVTAFERGHDLDPAIPRLGYLSLRTWSRRVDPPAPVTPPTT